MKKILLSIIALSCCFIAKAQLTGMNPNTAGPGQNLQTTVTGPGLFIQSSSPSGNIFSVTLTNGPTTITIFDYGMFMFNYLTVLSTDEFITDYFSIPINATPGQYLLTVVTGDVWNPWWNQQTYTLPNAFTVSPPDGYINGTVYNDLNHNGTQDAGELGMPNQTVRVLPPYFYLTTDASGNYSTPAMNGVYTVQWLPNSSENYQLSSDSASYSILVNSNTQSGFDFGLKPALLSMSINYAEIGQTVTTIITSDSLFTSAPSTIYIYKGGYYVYATNITLLDINHVRCRFTIPFSAGYIGSYYIRVTVGNTYTLLSAFTVTTFSAGITGKVFYDTNVNGIYDTGEPLLANSKIQLTPGNLLAFTDNNGGYGFNTGNGNFTVTYLPRNYESITSPASYNVTVNNTVVGGKDFGVMLSPTFDSLGLLVWHTLLRCNALQSVYVQVTNNGGDPADGRIYLIKDPSMTNAPSVPPADYVNGDTLYWIFTNLAPGQTLTIFPTFTNPPAGTPISFDVSARQYDAGNNLLFSQTQNFSSFVSCAWDPNDKQVNPPGVQAQHFTSFGDPLYYTIRFQNTGTDTAFRVIIYDTLDADLDFNTFEFLTSTHAVKTQLNPVNGALKFTFNNILLPDSNVNEPASHGEVTYRIKTKTGLPDNTLVNNKAYIVFDLNPPVITNTAFNTMMHEPPDPLPVELLYFKGVCTDKEISLKWSTASEKNCKSFTVEKRTDENKFMPLTEVAGAGNSASTRIYTVADKNPPGEFNYYRLAQTDYNGYTSIISDITEVRNCTESDVLTMDLIENPSEPSLVVISPANDNLQLTVFNIQGMLIYSEKVEIKKGFNKIKLNTEPLNAAIYLLRVESNLQTLNKKFLVSK